MSLAWLQSALGKAFKKRLKKSAGRNFFGRICVFHQGGGHFSMYRVIDFYRRLNTFGRVIRISKDSFRSAFVATLLYMNGLVASSISVDNLALGTWLFSGYILPRKSLIPFSAGSAIPLRYVNLFSVVCCVEPVPGQGSSFFRAAGVSALLVSKDLSFGVLKCSSGWLLKISLDSLVTLGRCSNSAHHYKRISKAGVNRQKGIRPTVRGVVKNPCDHPHGGGEGKGSPPAAQLSP